MQEPTELDIAIWDRRSQGLCSFGPLTRGEADKEAAYEQYMQESWEEHQAERAAGGRTICPQCGQRSVVHKTVCTYGRWGVEGSDYSDYGICENCDYKDLA